MAERTPTEIAYSYLGKRERTVSEVRDRLARSGIDESEVDAVISELIALGSLDDARYARLYAQDKRTLEQWGTDRIVRELSRRGISRELIECTIDDPEQGTELERAVAVIERRFAGELRDRRLRERALGVLLRKGYDSDLALEAVNVVVGR